MTIALDCITTSAAHGQAPETRREECGCPGFDRRLALTWCLLTAHKENLHEYKHYVVVVKGFGPQVGGRSGVDGSGRSTQRERPPEGSIWRLDSDIGESSDRDRKGRLPVDVPRRAGTAHHFSQYLAGPGTGKPTHRTGRGDRDQGRRDLDAAGDLKSRPGTRFVSSGGSQPRLHSSKLAPVPMSGMTAIEGLTDVGRLERGESVPIFQLSDAKSKGPIRTTGPSRELRVS